MKAVYALYSEPEQVQRAVDRLRAAGVLNHEIVVVSSEPFEEYEFSYRDSATWMYWIAGGGGAIGLLTAIWLVMLTQQAWPLVTGNMPIVAWWPALIIMFELTMLGAILATVTALLITAKLPNRGPMLYEPEISDGAILVGVQNPSVEAVPRLEEALAGAGEGRLKHLP